MPKITYREPDNDRMRRFGLFLFLTGSSAAFLSLIAVVGFGTLQQVRLISAIFAGLAILLALNTWILQNAALHLLLVLCAVGAIGPGELVFAWYTTHGFGISSTVSDLGFCVLFVVMFGLSVAEARQADLDAFQKELLKTGGLRKRSENAFDLRMRSAPKTGPHGPYFRPFRLLAWFDIVSALLFGVVLIVVAPIALTQLGNENIQKEAVIFVIIFIGVGWLLRGVLTATIVNWRLLKHLSKQQ